ncbi:hypothetical protein BGZ52_000425, partial [Haplosporangium bisporale]
KDGPCGGIPWPVGGVPHVWPQPDRGHDENWRPHRRCTNTHWSTTPPREPDSRQNL